MYLLSKARMRKGEEKPLANETLTKLTFISNEWVSSMDHGREGRGGCSVCDDLPATNHHLARRKALDKAELRDIL